MTLSRLIHKTCLKERSIIIIILKQCAILGWMRGDRTVDLAIGGIKITTIRGRSSWRSQHQMH
ncbi:hypothetical protein [Phormidium tenue]|uniref:Uncharacterized protein n=1 Tax=Phormidium tenue FACHB-1050 TaxID=2692857 RepID=A0ABR8C8G4_9CYAN|nr:hypothetical protein [Phormidium tenue]MBD2317088.1 hypothetical protein [Phormidium tenue FACHB-1050]